MVKHIPADFRAATFYADGASVFFNSQSENRSLLLTVNPFVYEPEAIAKGIAIAMNNYAKRQNYETGTRHGRDIQPARPKPDCGPND